LGGGGKNLQNRVHLGKATLSYRNENIISEGNFGAHVEHTVRQFKAGVGGRRTALLPLGGEEILGGGKRGSVHMCRRHLKVSRTLKKKGFNKSVSNWNREVGRKNQCAPTNLRPWSRQVQKKTEKSVRSRTRPRSMVSLRGSRKSGTTEKWNRYPVLDQNWAPSGNNSLPKQREGQQ